MKLNKTMGCLLFDLFGPNGSSVMVHSSQKTRWKAVKELCRHGIVKIEQEHKGVSPNLFTVKRIIAD